MVPGPLALTGPANGERGLGEPPWSGDNAPVTRTPSVIAGTCTVASVAGTALLLFGETPYQPMPALLASGGLLVLTVVAVAGLLIARSRWARPVLAGCSLAWLGVCAVGAPSPVWAVTVAAASASLAGVTGPWLGRWVRRRPSASGPSPLVTTLLLSLAAAPAATGLASPSGVHAAVFTWAWWCPMVAVALGRGAVGSLASARVITPALALGAAAMAALPGGIVAPLVAVLPTALAWRREVRIAVAPVAPERVDPVPFPPELVPPEVLAAAGLDDRGRRIEDAT